MPTLPLEGIRVTSLSHFWAASHCAAFLGALGAEVIKVESIQRPDGQRFGPPVCDRWWEVDGIWNSINVNNLGITLNLTDSRGIRLLKDLVRTSDIVLENFSVRVLESFGLTYPVLCEIKPDLIMLSMPTYGQTGPWRSYTGWGLTFEHVSGFSALTGYRGGEPFNIGGFIDPVAGMYASFAVLSALEYRRTTGEGQYIDMSQVEAAASLLGVAFMDYSMNGRIWERLGNRDRVMAPHGVYPCSGDDKWIAIAVSNDQDWQALCGVMRESGSAEVHGNGAPQVADDPCFADVLARSKNQDALDEIITAWTSIRDQYQVMHVLQQAGIAAIVLTEPHLLHHEHHYQNRQFFCELNREIVGTQIYPQWPVRFSDFTTRIFPAPLLGQHNEYVLGSILGLSSSEIDELVEAKVIGDRPLGQT